MKKLIVNADDFGVTESVNEGIIYGFKNGIITSTSLMVNRPYAKEAAQMAKDLSTGRQEIPSLGIGLHFTVYDGNNQIIRGDEKLSIFFSSRENLEKAITQFLNQIERFRELTGKMPDHIDGHHHAHKVPEFLPFIKEFSFKNKIPLRAIGPVKFIDKFSDVLHPEYNSVENLVQLLKTLPEGISEIMTHSGFSSDELRKVSSLSDQREAELKTLTSPEIKKVIQEEEIELINWSQI